MTDQRTGTTRSGRVVPLNTLTEVDGGHEGYILHPQGHAVRIFIPGPDGYEQLDRTRCMIANAEASPLPSVDDQASVRWHLDEVRAIYRRHYDAGGKVNG